MLRDGGSAEHGAGVQWFFKDAVQSRGWYTGDLRKLAARLRRDLIPGDTALLVNVADRLFQGPILEERALAVLLLEKSVGKFGEREFRRFASWLDRLRSWADHDALLHYLIGPMLASDPKRARYPFCWAKSRDRWHRRAAAVAFIRGARRKMFFAEISRMAGLLLDDEDDMVQKGLGWLLRETAKADPQRTIPLLMKIRARAPRLVLRTACETLPAAKRANILKNW
jgi:3-methyladenine DNA glycosylase AlkD